MRMTQKILGLLVLVSALMGCGDDGSNGMVGVADNPTRFFECDLGDDADDVIDRLKAAKTYKVSLDSKDNPTSVTLTGKTKSDAVKWRNTNYDQAVLNLSDEVFTSIELTKTYANKGSLTKFVNRLNANEEAAIQKTDTTCTYVIAGAESRCSIAVNLPERMVVTTYTDNRMWVKPSTWDRIVNFVCNPFDNIWSLAMWALILGLAYAAYTHYNNPSIENNEDDEDE